MTTEPITAALIEVCVFFSTCEDSILDADAAVEQLEHIASHLKLLDNEGRQHFLLAIQESANREGLTASASTRIECLQTLGESLGIA